jgi:hypothetical protein
VGGKISKEDESMACVEKIVDSMNSGDFGGVSRLE